MEPNRDVIFEFHQNGSYMKVTAVDTSSFSEVSIVTPSHLPQSRMEALALQKLNYVLATNNRPSEKQQPTSKKGILV